MNIHKYDIFAGRSKEDAVWIDAVEGLEAASNRMRVVATEKPGPYFVICTETNRILNSVDTSAWSDIHFSLGKLGVEV